LLVARTLPVVERLPIAVAIGLIGDPSIEIGPSVVWVVVFVVLAVIPVVLRVPIAVRGPPLVVNMDVVVLLAVGRLLCVFRIVRVAPEIVIGPLVPVILGAIRFAVLEVTIGVVVLLLPVAVIRSALVGEDRRSHEHHCRQQPQKQHQPSQLILLPKTSHYSISRRTVS
jgi:hypothetical protein